MIMSQSAIKMAPPFSLVSKFFICSCFYLFIVSLFLPFALKDINFSVLGLNFAGFIHLYLLGFAMMIIIGALYQLTPVVLEVGFISLKFSNLVFYFFAFGSAVFSISMIFSNTFFMSFGAGIIYISLLYFDITFLLSFTKINEWNFIRFILFSAGICLFLGLSFGFLSLLIIQAQIPFEDFYFWVKRHILFTFGGFTYLVILGVSLVLLPMFSLAHHFKTIFAKISFLFIILSFFASIFENLEFISKTFLHVSLFFYIVQCLEILRLRARKKKDYWFINIVLSLFCLTIALIFFLFDDERFLKISVFLALFGFMFHFIVGHLYKILPFLIWYKFISPLVGKTKIPMLHEMINEKFAYLQIIFSFLGIFCLCLGVLMNINIIFIGCTFFAFAIWSILYNVYFAYNFRKFKEKI